MPIPQNTKKRSSPVSKQDTADDFDLKEDTTEQDYDNYDEDDDEIEEDYEVESPRGFLGQFSLMQKVVGGAAIFVVICILITILGKSKTNNQSSTQDDLNSNPAVDYTQNSTDQTEEPQESYNTDQFELPDFDGENVSNVTDPVVCNADDFLKDIDGTDVPALYNVANRTYKNIFVNYTKHRGVLDDGMEVYWLDIDYEGKKYRCQTAFYYYRALKDSGITVVNAEILQLEGGGQIISYMQVVDNYKDLINPEN